MPISDIVISPNINSFWFSEAVNNGLNVLNQGDFQHQILQYQSRPLYLQKCLMDDPITLEFHTYYSGFSTIHLCSHVVGLDQKPTIITAADSLLNASPILKSKQVVAGNVWRDPYTGSEYGLTTMGWAFTFDDLAAFVTPDNPDSIYYIMIDAAGYQCYSEPIFLRTSKFDKWGNNIAFPNTMLFKSTYNANRAGNTNVVVSGWFDDYPTNLVPYTPQFATRCEALILQDDPMLVAIEYLIQNYNSNFITGTQIDRQILKIGEISLGVPRYMQKMITEFMMSDRTSITQGAFNVLGVPIYYQYKIWAPGSNTTPQAYWKTKADDNFPLIYSTMPISLGSSSQNVMANPLPVLPTGIFTDVFDLTFL